MEVAVLGRHQISEDALLAAMTGARNLNELDKFAAFLPDSVLVVALDESGAMRCQGTTNGSSAIFWVSQGSDIYVSDCQALLATVLELQIDRDELCVRLSDAEFSFPYLIGTIWAGMKSVQPGHWIRIQPREMPRTIPWWHLPDPDMELNQLAPLLNTAVQSVLEMLITSDEELRCDLSGGLDSTSLAYFTKELKSDFQTLFLNSADATNADRFWSDCAARDLMTNHQVLDYSTVAGSALVFGTDLAQRLPEGPSEAARYLPLVDAVAERSGSTPCLHLNGHGGDELFGAVAGMSWSLVRSRHPPRFRDAIGFGQVNKQSILSTLRLVLRFGGAQSDLRRIASSNLDREHDEYTEGARWVPSVLAPTCLTDSARDHIRTRSVSYIQLPGLHLHKDRTMHRIREANLFHGALLRRMNLMRPSGTGVEFAAPYLDRRIADVALRLRIEDRFNAHLVKPLLAQARPTRMPIDYFERRDKGEYSAETFNAFKRVRQRLLGTFDHGSLLEDQGLLDPGRFRKSVSEYSVDGRLHDETMRIELVELWMRSFEAHQGATIDRSIH